MKLIKLFLFAVLTLSTTISLQAQEKSKRPSPPAQAEASVNGTNVLIDYSSPAVKGRKLYGKLIPNNKLWRTGANEATTFEVSTDVMIEGQKLAAGKYALFTIANADEWTIIFNAEPNQWGAYKYKESKDVLRIKVKPTKGEFSERMKFNIADDGKVKLNWGDIEVGFLVEVK